MRVLVACERSGVVREAFRAKGHDAWSCDLAPADDKSLHHHDADALDVAFHNPWDLVIVHPPCTYLCSSGIHWNKRIPERDEHTQVAKNFFMSFTKLNCAWAIENPVGIMSTQYRKPDQIIQPFYFDEDASKATCLWLHRLPLLHPTTRRSGRLMLKGNKVIERWSNQTDSGQNRLGPDENRGFARSITYPNIAAAMAEQWTEETIQ